MNSDDEDTPKRAALIVVFGAVAAVVVAVVVFGASYQRRGAAQSSIVTTAVAMVRATEASTAAAPAVDASASALAASDAASIKVEDGVVKFYFASGKADLAAGANEALAGVVMQGKDGASAGRKLLVSGFHDATGDAAQNAELAKQRALAVRDALVAAGVGLSQIDLKKPEQTSAGGSNAEARRVEVSVQ